MTNKFGLSAEVIEKVLDVFAKHSEIEQVVIYGSRAKGNYKAGSDIDLTLKGSKELDMEVLYQVIGELDELNLPYTFDVSLYNSITNKDLIDHIDRVGVDFDWKKKNSLADLAELSSLDKSKGMPLTDLDEEIYSI